LLTLVTFNWLFFGTVIGFFCSAALVVSVTIPQPPAARPRRGFYDDTKRGMRIDLATPRLRGLVALNLAAAAAGSMVFVNTVVLVKGTLGGTDGNVALALACFGGGSMAAALLLPRLLDRLPDRRIMLSSAGMLAVVLAAFGAIMTVAVGTVGVRYALLPTWVLLGIGHSGVMTPSGRLLRRSAGAVDRPAVLAAHFALSHLCWLLTYPLAGWLGSSAGIANRIGACSPDVERRRAGVPILAGSRRRPRSASTSRTIIRSSAFARAAVGTCARLCDRRPAPSMALGGADTALPDSTASALVAPVPLSMVRTCLR
jgi:hypothetical protein